jgi:SPP1 gp7 family putative phage head morphogenesis protein
MEANREYTSEEAIAILKKRELVLAGEVESDLVTAIKEILLHYLAGTPLKSTQASIANILDHNMNRASLIVTTETTYAYNRGRLISYRENKVDYVRFSAIMDSRTSQICQSRQGLVMGMDDSDLSSNTPPLHGRCRSVLTPIYSRYEPELITDSNTNWSDAAPLPKGWKK